MLVRRLEMLDVEGLAYRLARKIMEWDEPIPDFSTRYPGVLESCLATPFQTYLSKDLYRGLVDKASMLFYLMIKNHPFENGNKRIAVCTLLTMLAVNGKWLETSSSNLYVFAKWVAESLPESKDGVLIAIREFIQRYLVDYK